MPAHLESTDRALKAEQNGVGQDRRDRTIDEDQDGQQDRKMVSDVTAPGVKDKRWRTRVKAAVVLKKDRKLKGNHGGKGSEEHQDTEPDEQPMVGGD